MVRAFSVGCYGYIFLKGNSHDLQLKTWYTAPRFFRFVHLYRGAGESKKLHPTRIRGLSMKKALFSFAVLLLFAACNNPQQPPIIIMKDTVKKNPEPGRTPMQKWIECPHCFGTGQCPQCLGAGVLYGPNGEYICPVCHGDGDCFYCAGHGGHNDIVYVK